MCDHTRLITQQTDEDESCEICMIDRADVILSYLGSKLIVMMLSTCRIYIVFMVSSQCSVQSGESELYHSKIEDEDGK